MPSAVSGTAAVFSSPSCTNDQSVIEAVSSIRSFG